eukprot:59914-Prymnesium_polylepis.2
MESSAANRCVLAWFTHSHLLRSAPRWANGTRNPGGWLVPASSLVQSAGSTAKLRHSGRSEQISACTAMAREIAPSPDALLRRSACFLAAYPISSTAPQLRPWPHTPPWRRQLTIASNQALDAECGAWPDEPINAATEEYTLKKVSGLAHVTAWSD